MRTLPLADLGRASPLVSERLGIFAPIDHFSSDGAGRNAIRAECNIVCYQFAGTPGIQVDDAANIIMFQHGIDGESVVGGIQNRFSQFPLRVPVTQFMVPANPRDGVMRACAEQPGVNR